VKPNRTEQLELVPRAVVAPAPMRLRDLPGAPPPAKPMPADWPPSLAIAEARRRLRALLGEGADCPVCDQFCRRYRYTLSENNCRFLAVLYRVDRREPGAYTHINTILEQDSRALASRDYNRLLYWNLIEEMENDDQSKKKRSGLWRITGAGREFCTGARTIQKYAVVYNDSIEGFEGEQVTMRDFEGEHFNYREHLDR